MLWQKVCNQGNLCRGDEVEGDCDDCNGHYDDDDGNDCDDSEDDSGDDDDNDNDDHVAVGASGVHPVGVHKLDCCLANRLHWTIHLKNVITIVLIMIMIMIMLAMIVLIMI